MFFVSPSTDLEKTQCPFDSNMTLVGKPDQLVKRRGKLGLVELNMTWDETVIWLRKIRGRKLIVNNTWDKLDYFLIEPFIPHDQNEEHYLCIRSTSSGDEILFCVEGGVDVGDVDSKVCYCCISFCFLFFFFIFCCCHPCAKKRKNI